MKMVGLRALEADLFQLEKHTTRKSVARKVLKNAGGPLADRMNNTAPDDPNTPGGLSASHSVSTKLNKSQARQARRNKSQVEVYVGTNDPAAIQQEYGNINHGPQPYGRQAWDSMRGEILNQIKSDMGDEIVKSAARQAKRNAKR